MFAHSIYYLNFIIQGIEKFDRDLSTLHPILAECRVQKSNLELSLIQFANDISSEAHVKVSSLHTSEKNGFLKEKFSLFNYICTSASTSKLGCSI